ncbi:hypothetical protein BH18VER1_BH18VER1_14340 [soil metagenome]
MRVTERVAVITGGSDELAGALAMELRRQRFLVHAPRPRIA